MCGRGRQEEEKRDREKVLLNVVRLVVCKSIIIDVCLLTRSLARSFDRELLAYLLTCLFTLLLARSIANFLLT